jgi:hypothetical protein
MQMYYRKFQKHKFLGSLICLFLLGQSIIAQDFSNGTWIKTYIPKEGLQVLTYDWLLKNKLNPSSIDVEKIAIYQDIRGIRDTLQWQLHPEKLNQLIQIPTKGIGLEDLKFDPSDKLFFPVKASITQQSDSTFCLLHFGNEKSIFVNEKVLNLEGKNESFAFQELILDEEKYNYLQSGQLWVSEPIYSNESKIISFQLKDLYPGASSYFKTKLYASSIQDSQILIKSPSFSKTISFNAISGDRYDRKADQKLIELEFNAPKENEKLEIQFQYLSKIGSACIGKNALLYPRIVKGSENSWLEWPNHLANENAKIIQIANLNKDTQAWLFNEINQFELLSISNEKIVIQKPVKSKLLMADSKLAYEPIFVEKIQTFRNNLSAQTELLIIYPKAFENAAKKLATFKNQQKIPSEIRSLENILTEFGSGKMSLPGIKSYLYHQKINLKSKLNYLVLLSDANVDIKGKNNLLGTDKAIQFIPTYESEESLFPLNSYASDDYYGILGDTLGDWDINLNKKYEIELSIGRIPAKTIQEAELMVNKVIQAQNISDKNSNIALIADDEDNNIHLLDAEDFSKQLETNAPQFLIQKLYLDAYPMKASNGLYTSPEVQKKIQSLFNKEAGFIHFMGHGSESGWTDEKILTTNDILSLTNSSNLPILLTATCQFAKFDNPYILSGSEVLIGSDRGGAQAIIGTSRPVFQSNNYVFGKNFYSILLQNIYNSNYRLGDLVRDVKNKGNVGIGNRNIVLLGDPSCSLPWTGNKIDIKGENVSWGKTQNIKIQNNTSETIDGSLQLFAVKENIETVGTKSPKISFKPSDQIIYQKDLNLLNGSTNVVIPPVLQQKTNKIHYRFHGISNSGKRWGFYENQISELSQLNGDKNGPIIQQDLIDNNRFVISDSSGLGFLDALGKKSSILINESLEIPIQHLVTSFKNDKNWSLLIDPQLLDLQTNTIQFHVCDLLQNVTEKTFKISLDPKIQSILLVYPNPFIDQINIEFKELNNWTSYNYQARVYNLNGQLVKHFEGGLTEKSISLPMAGLVKNNQYLLVFEIFDPINRSSKTYVSKLISGL